MSSELLSTQNKTATKKSYLIDAYLAEGEGTVVAHVGRNGIALDQTIFYAEGGGQPGDTGVIAFDGLEIAVLDTRESSNRRVVLTLSESDTTPLPPVGTKVMQRVDWERRHKHMRMHTALHLLTVALPFPVTGGQISADKGRLDFNMPAPPGGKTEIEALLNDLVTKDLPVTARWGKAEDLARNPGLVKTQLVQPPTNEGDIRMIAIGNTDVSVDLQPCGGTHVARTGEIGRLVVGKIENKGRDNRRVILRFA